MHRQILQDLFPIGMGWISLFRYSTGFHVICSPSVLTGFRLFRYSSGFCMICSPSVLTGSRLFRYSSGFHVICSPSVLTESRLFRYSSGFHVICSPSVALIYGEQLLEICRLYLNGSLRQKFQEYISGESASCT